MFITKICFNIEREKNMENKTATKKSTLKTLKYILNGANRIEQNLNRDVTIKLSLTTIDGQEINFDRYDYELYDYKELVKEYGNTAIIDLPNSKYIVNVNEESQNLVEDDYELFDDIPLLLPLEQKEKDSIIKNPIISLKALNDFCFWNIIQINSQHNSVAFLAPQVSKVKELQKKS